MGAETDNLPTADFWNVQDSVVGHVRTNWRTRWFVLWADELRYFKKKEDDVPAGIVNLRGCSVISPVPQYTKKTDVFQVSSMAGQDLLIQASGDKEREDWVVAISEAIRGVDAVKSDEHGDDGSLYDLVSAMQDSGGGITLGTHVVGLKKYNNCFTGANVIDWLLEWSFVSSREEGADQCNRLLEQAHLQIIENAEEQQDLKTFQDDSTSLYRFSAFISSSRDPLSSSSDESDSDEEMKKVKQKVVIPSKLLNGPSGGKLIKQGFLLKRGHVRRTWKARLFLLWDKPQLLQYYRGSKIEEEKPLGEVDINYCSVDIINANSSDSKVKNKSRSNLFSVKTRKGKLYIFQASSPEERESWIRAIMCPGDFN